MTSSQENKSHISKYSSNNISLNYEDNLVLVVLVAITLSILTLWTIVGNTLVLVALVRDKRLRSTPNILIGNLAVSDLLLALTILPLSIVGDVLGYWVFGLLLCNLWLSMDVLYCTASVWGLVVIAFDRYTATKYPVWYRGKSGEKRSIPYILFVWILSVLICLPPIIGWDGKTFTKPSVKFRKNYLHENATRYHQCILFSEPTYVIYSSMGSFVIPLIVMVLLYARIFAIMRDHGKMFRPSHQSPFPTMGLNILNTRPNGVKQRLEQIELTSATSSEKDETTDDIDDDDDEEVLNPSHPPAPAISWNLPSTPLADRKRRLERSRNSSNSNSTLLTPNHTSKPTPTPPPKKSPPFLPPPSPPPVQFNRVRRPTLAALFLRRSDTLTATEKREQRATKRMALVIGFFLLCWIPFTLMYLIRSLCGDKICPDIPHLRITVIWLGYANSGLNPILYTIFNLEFRRAFHSIITFSSIDR